MKRSVASYPIMAAAIVLAAISTQATAQTKAPASPLKYSVSARVLFDNNVYLQDDTTLAAGQTVAATPAEADSWVGVGSFTIAYSDKSNAACAIDVSYAPEVWHYDSYHQENHVDQRFVGSLAGKQGNWRYEAKTNYLYVIGSKTSPIYNRLGGGPAIGGAPVRNRRTQELLRGSGFLTYSFDPWFVRLATTDSLQDFHTYERSTSGYANYADRSDINAGLDLGYKVNKDVSSFVGFRYGNQKQANLLGVNNNFSNKYTRLFAGVEGILLPNLKLSVTAGPDYRRYGTARKVGTAQNRVDTYIDTTGSWTPNKTDTVTFGTKRNMIVGGGGRGAYSDMLTELGWKHVFNPKWTTAFTASQEDADFKDMTSSLRHDWIYQVGLTATYTLPTKSKLDFAVLRDWGQTSVDNTPGRAYHRWMAAVGISHTF